MMIISVSSGTVYVQSGSDITDCNMKCPLKEGKMELYRQCGEKEKTMIEYFPHYKYTNYHDSRIRLHAGSGCWKLTHIRKDDSCVYETWCYIYNDKDYLLSSTEIRVLDPVLISNITSNFNRFGEEMAVSIQFSGEESAVTWEVDREPIPERYRLIDDNRTLIIPSVQRDDPERRFRVRITNPVSEEIREYQLINDTRFIRMLETEGIGNYGGVMLYSMYGGVIDWGPVSSSLGDHSGRVTQNSNIVSCCLFSALLMEDYTGDMSHDH
ncbi:uncharacterized protein LOC143984212 [Lithobates pipiens]